MGDIEILFDVCWILSPSQIQKLISQYHNADYEAPISAEILKAVASRVKPDDKSDHLLLTPETDEVGPYQLPTPREIAGLETCECGAIRDRRQLTSRCPGLAECTARQASGDFCLINSSKTHEVQYDDNGTRRCITMAGLEYGLKVVGKGFSCTR